MGPPEGLRQVLIDSLDRLTHYPDPDCAELCAAIACGDGVPAEQIVVGNGSSEILFAIARACAPGRVVIPVPSYVDYAAAAHSAGRETVLLPLCESQGFALDWESLESQLRPGDVVLLGQPNNPTGLALDTARLLHAAAAHPETTWVLDESFAGFIDGYRSPLAQRPANLLVVRSFTKLYAIPGLRLGYAIARPELAAAVRRQLAPWSVNTLAQAAGAALLADCDFVERSVAFVAQQRRRLAERLLRRPGLYVYPGVANFLLLRLDQAGIDAHELAHRLLLQGIAIRTFAAGQYLDHRFFRIAVRTAEENDRLCAALEDKISEWHVFSGWHVPEERRAWRIARTPEGDSPIFAETKIGTVPKRTPAIMLQGTSSNAGKSVLTAALCRIMFQDGIRVAPFKAQNMSLNSFVTRDGGEIGRAQVVQAQACRIEPDVRMNPILLKPNSDTGSQVIVRGRPIGNMPVEDYIRYKREAAATVRECYDSLSAEFDAVVLEGAGSPAEVNLKSHDMVNMRMAQHAAAPVLIVGDIDRGGLFAALVGTWEVLDPWERALVAGWIVNRFRGDASLLQPALDYTQVRTGRPVLGVVPYLNALNLPQEDSVDFKEQARTPHMPCTVFRSPGIRSTEDEGGTGPVPHTETVEIAVIDLPHLANFTDFDCFGVEPDVSVRIVRSPADLNRPDAVLIGGSKNALADLSTLRTSGLAARIMELARSGKTEIVGLCGGLQMLGREIRDPLAIESPQGAADGLGLLDVTTVLAAEKMLVRTSARHVPSGIEVSGYEIHHGQTDLGGAVPVLRTAEGRVIGLACPERPVWGTYLHGIFDCDPFRRWFIDALRTRRGWQPVGKLLGRYDIEPALDRLAQVVRECLPIETIYRWMGLR